jgi:hypothetical protein
VKNPHAKPHQVGVSVRFSEAENKWHVTVSGVSYGVEILPGDELSLVFELDASRFHPVLVTE